MPAIKLIQPGWTAFTGVLHNIAFTNGVSGNVSQIQFDRIAANFLCEDNASAGVQAGPSVSVKPVTRVGANPTGIASSGPTKIGLTVSMTQAAYDALSVKDPNTLYLIEA